ncbi:dTMP kinase [Mycoplasma sp. P36-A1]|uniref:dTMP kinase n=1 Tax=Mycoplasma sp. P36-A1 TaxID=3252900 RepID=UPI003C2BDA3D
MKQGLFITFEGPDGSGKTTILEKITQYFKTEGIDFIKTREPGGSAIAQQIRGVVLDENNKNLSATTEALLFAASRAQHFDEIIVPTLKENKVLLCDRFIDSSLVYQGIARGLGVEQVLSINNFAIQGKMPDLTIFFDVKPHIGLARIASNNNREVNRLDLEDIEFHQKVYDGYLMIRDMYKSRFRTVDASQDIDTVFEQVKNIIKENLNG